MFGGSDLPLAVDGIAECIEHSADYRLAARNGVDQLQALDLITFTNCLAIAENRDTDVVLFEIQDYATFAASEFNQFACHHLLQAIDTGNAIAH